MSRPPQRFLAQMTKNQLAEMMAPTYAAISQVDPNEAYTRLEPSLKDLELIEAVQSTLWRAITAAKPDATQEQILDLITKKQSKSRKFRPAKVTGKDEGAWVALGLYLDLYAGVASGEAADLLDTDQGQKLLDRGLDLLGEHLAKEVLR